MPKLILNFVNKNQGDLVKATAEGGFYNAITTNTTTNNTLTLNLLGGGDYTLTVEGDGYEDYTQSVSVVGDTTVEVVLVPVVVKYPYVPADNLYLGNIEIQKAYLGSELVWEADKLS